jgi:hypothetical protein
LKNVSTKECREKVLNFQKLILHKREEILPAFIDISKQVGITYSIGDEKAFEYVVLEYGFAYWQWSKGDCSDIPDSSADLNEMLEHFVMHSPIDYFSDAGIKSLWSFFYQAYTEVGYYDYDIEPFKDLLKYADGKTRFFIPPDAEINFDDSVMKDIDHFIQDEANNFIFIYGGNDPWSSTSVCLSGKTNSLKMVHPGGSHLTRIKSFSETDQELIYKKLEEWLDINIVRNE